MVDKNFCMSAFLALRYVEKPGVDFTEKFPYRRPELQEEGKLPVQTAADVDLAIGSQFAPLREKYGKIGLLLSGGMDSAVLASYLPGCEAYTFRFFRRRLSNGRTAACRTFRGVQRYEPALCGYHLGSGEAYHRAYHAA